VVFYDFLFFWEEAQKKKANYPISAGLKVAPGKKVAENRVCRFKNFVIKAAQKKKQHQHSKTSDSLHLSSLFEKKTRFGVIIRAFVL
jgi:hypothetical protein